MNDFDHIPKQRDQWHAFVQAPSTPSLPILKEAAGPSDGSSTNPAKTEIKNDVVQDVFFFPPSFPKKFAAVGLQWRSRGGEAIPRVPTSVVGAVTVPDAEAR